MKRLSRFVLSLVILPSALAWHFRMESRLPAQNEQLNLDGEWGISDPDVDRGLDLSITGGRAIFIHARNMTVKPAVDVREITSQHCFAIRLHSDRIDYSVGSRCEIESRKGVTGVIRVPFSIQGAGWLIIREDRDRDCVDWPDGGAAVADHRDDKVLIEFDGVVIGDENPECFSAFEGAEP